ncbi:hypothetical protein [Herbaspirillum aquaticum]|uniref:Uncharacterized protein n=2 Tax=Herbaspirillum aquaticum TaxID=568783 RepID=A0A225SUW3_9BURK|nr:hypothetical protein [Herbaspirillum aquaticum]OWY34645.1 hypothetical protein CEJ45_10110 [Herbaspirillum aquaticum]
MQATIYVSEEAMATAIAIKDLSHYDRITLSDDPNTDLSQSPGYFLKNANKLKLATLPTNHRVIASLAPGRADNIADVSMPVHLRGCIFERAPNLPPQYAQIMTYWSGEAVNLDDSRAVHFQSPLNEYMVELRPAQGRVEDAYSEMAACDRLLSEGIVVAITGLMQLCNSALPTDFIEIVLPVDLDIAGIEPDAFRSSRSYNVDDEQLEKVYLRIVDIMRSPNPDAIYIDLIRNELIDYGYVY